MADIARGAHHQHDLHIAGRAPFPPGIPGAGQIDSSLLLPAPMKTPSQRTLSPFLASILVLAVLSLLCVGCQTTKGFGRDVQHVGEKIEGKN